MVWFAIHLLLKTFTLLLVQFAGTNVHKFPFLEFSPTSFEERDDLNAKIDPP